MIGSIDDKTFKAILPELQKIPTERYLKKISAKVLAYLVDRAESFNLKRSVIAKADKLTRIPVATLGVMNHSSTQQLFSNRYMISQPSMFWRPAVNIYNSEFDRQLATKRTELNEIANYILELENCIFSEEHTYEFINRNDVMLMRSAPINMRYINLYRDEIELMRERYRLLSQQINELESYLSNHACQSGIGSYQHRYR